MTRERITREDYDSLVERAIGNDICAGGPAIDHRGRSRREYVESYLREQYEIVDQDERDA